VLNRREGRIPNRQGARTLHLPDPTNPRLVRPRRGRLHRAVCAREHVEEGGESRSRAGARLGRRQDFTVPSYGDPHPSLDEARHASPCRWSACNLRTSPPHGELRRPRCFQARTANDGTSCSGSSSRSTG